MEAIDCATRLNAQTAAAVKAAGIVAVGRYLGYKTTSWSKTLTPEELQAIHTAGLLVFLVWESNPTFAGYFNYAKGTADAELAVEEAMCLGAPKGTTLYFTVDYDAQASDMAAIVEYFRGIRDGIGQYLVGAYGSYSVLNALKNSADKYWQTYAWSGSKVFPGNIYQYQNNVTVGGIPADKDKINTAPGAWPEIGGKDVKLNDLVLYYGDADLPIAADLAANFQCPVIQAAYVTADLLASATNKYQVGGSSAPAGVTLLAGADRFDTMKAVLHAIGKI